MKIPRRKRCRRGDQPAHPTGRKVDREPRRSQESVWIRQPGGHANVSVKGSVFCRRRVEVMSHIDTLLLRRRSPNYKRISYERY
jgi:hypothetical protein